MARSAHVALNLAPMLHARQGCRRRSARMSSIPHHQGPAHESHELPTPFLELAPCKHKRAKQVPFGPARMTTSQLCARIHGAHFPHPPRAKEECDRGIRRVRSAKSSSAARVAPKRLRVVSRELRRMCQLSLCRPHSQRSRVHFSARASHTRTMRPPWARACEQSDGGGTAAWRGTLKVRGSASCRHRNGQRLRCAATAPASAPSSSPAPTFATTTTAAAPVSFAAVSTAATAAAATAAAA